MDICNRLVQLAKQRHLNQADMAKILDVSESFVSQMYNRKKSISIETIMCFCEHEGITLSDFFREDISPDKLSSNRYDHLFSGLNDIQIDLIRKLIDQIKLAKSYNDEICFLPLLGDAAAGTPVNSHGNGDILVPVPQKYLDGRFFVVVARGDSMEPRIKNGDYVVVQKDTPGEVGDIVLARIESLDEGEYMIKRFYPHTNDIEFRSYNPAYNPIFYKSTQVLSANKIVHIIHRH